MGLEMGLDLYAPNKSLLFYVWSHKIVKHIAENMGRLCKRMWKKDNISTLNALGFERSVNGSVFVENLWKTTGILT